MSNMIKSLIGKKFWMGISAIFLILFLLLHFALNFISVFSPDLYNTCSEFMGTNWVIQWVMQPVLIFGVIFHFAMGIYLEIKNKKARPIKYAKNNGAANSTWMSRNMIITGLVILAFLAIHFIDFWFPELNYHYYHIGDVSVNPTNYEALLAKFTNPIRVIAYCIAFVLLSLHLMHGFYGSMQSIGQSNKYSRTFVTFGKYFSVLIPLGFIVIAIALYIKA